MTLRRLGNVMWDMTEWHTMCPAELIGKLSLEDYNALNKVYEALTMYRRMPPVLSVIVKAKWDRMDLIKPYLIDTLLPRSGARQMIASGDWESFWSVL